MKVTLLNPEELKVLYKNHGEFACECYNTPKKFAEKVGKGCMSSGHMSGSRCEYIKFEIEADRGTMEQIMRSEIGVHQWPINQYLAFDIEDFEEYEDFIEKEQNVPSDEIVKNMQSFRYVDKDGFTYRTPINIANITEAKDVYDNIMDTIENGRKQIRDILIENGIDSHKAVEDANFVLPRATEGKLTIGFTPEALIRFMWKRLCLRAQDEIREIAIEMKKLVMEVNPEFAKNLVPHCQHLLWCPEGKQNCGAYPTKEKLKEIINNNTNININVNANNNEQ